jgi:hypothetical protein
VNDYDDDVRVISAGSLRDSCAGALPEAASRMGLVVRQLGGGEFSSVAGAEAT